MLRCAKYLLLVSGVLGLHQDLGHIVEIYHKEEWNGTGALILPTFVLTWSGWYTGGLHTSTNFKVRWKEVECAGKVYDLDKDRPVAVLEIERELAPSEIARTIPIATRFDSLYRPRCTVSTRFNDTLSRCRATIIGQKECKDSAGFSKGQSFCIIASHSFRTPGAILICRNIVAGVAPLQDCEKDRKCVFLTVTHWDISILRLPEARTVGYQEDNMPEYSIGEATISLRSVSTFMLCFMYILTSGFIV